MTVCLYAMYLSCCQYCHCHMQDKRSGEDNFSGSTGHEYILECDLPACRAPFGLRIVWHHHHQSQVRLLSDCTMIPSSQRWSHLAVIDTFPQLPEWHLPCHATKLYIVRLKRVQPCLSDPAEWTSR